MESKKVLTKRARRAAKKVFAKQPHNTHPFTFEDYKLLPKGEASA